MEIQKEAKEKNIPLRIGIHEGEVVVENEDVFGDGVNIASRIESEAAPGGICISDAVYRIIRNKDEFSVGRIGKVSLKNVRESIVLYQLKSAGLSARAKKKAIKLSWIVLFLIGLGGIVIGMIGTHIYIKKAFPPKVMHFSLNFPETAPLHKPFYRSVNHSFDISPDGEIIVYVGKTNNTTNLFRRPLNANSYELIPGTEHAENPFFSHDGKWIGFYSKNALRKVPVIGGKSSLLCFLKESTTCTWLPNDSIIFGGNQMEGLKIIHSSGGKERVLTQLDWEKEELMHSYPYYIHGTDKVLYAISSVAEYISINLLDLKTGEDKVLIKNASNPKYFQDGYLLYDYQGSLYANTFDSEKHTIGEEPILIIDNARNDNERHNMQYAFSQGGTLAFMVYQLTLTGELVQVDMNGSIKSLIQEDDNWIAGPKYSPDGKNLAFWMVKGEPNGSQVWTYNMEREILTRFTSEGTNAWPIWTPDGSRIAFPSIRGSSQDLNIYIKYFGTTAPSQPLIVGNRTMQPKAWSSNGKILLYHQQEESEKRWDVYMLNMDNMESEPFLNGNYDERKPDFSPDDNWVVYESSETGVLEVYVTDFPEKSVKHQVSISGGNEPMWSHQGDRIFFRNMNDFYVVQVSWEPEINLSKPEILFSGNYRQVGPWGRCYDLSPDESHIVAIREELADTTRASINVVTNFFEEIRRRDGGD
jgi:Tol biopolymer transport system component